MIEAQDDLDAFKTAHLPIEGNWDEIIMEYGEQEDIEMAPAGINDVEMMDPEEPEEPMELEEPEEPEDIDQDLLECTEHQKVLFTTQQLQGPASAWWANYEASLPAGRHTEWNEFKTAFRAHFIPAGLMQMKFQEFMDPKQGGRNVPQYSKAFNHLAEYAIEYVNTEEKKRYVFLHGMNATLKERLTWKALCAKWKKKIARGRPLLVPLLPHRRSIA
ncbi:hypothetical protein PR202_gb25380 [Eleusine coracana subsp. coracana]|uniref:Retrotransposon gag domain-containing protein n=1 Tax=Eleusine coracana subsp. coracana TaxID=191504 RepID=A0AAV5FPR3_ELECO|nr:hypothetical protein PR202_gb25336 [Eleusine coracana subsp. coracana]GJN36517.1 hypothetical protein PR202_gb25380 [Eleusine coracana subsp. coracana]